MKNITRYSVATQILEQLGGSKLMAMIGAHSFVAAGNSLIFKVPSKLTRQHIAGVKITLEASDTYTCEFGAFKGSLTKSNYRYEVVATYRDAYYANWGGWFPGPQEWDLFMLLPEWRRQEILASRG